MKASDIVVWLADTKTADSEAIYEQYGRFFEEKRQKAIERITNDKERKNQICSGFLLMTVLEKYGVCSSDIRYYENKKPYIYGANDLFFNLSHSKGRLMLAISGQEIGCDIQKHVECKESLVKRVCSEKEIADLGNLVYDKFNLVWAIKESYTKLTGTGISVDLRDILFSINQEDIKVFERESLSAYGKIAVSEEDCFGVFVGKKPFENVSVYNFSF